MTRAGPGTSTVVLYDLVRGLAALAVLGAHARELVFADLPLQRPLPIAGQLFFGVTALGHQAVIVFLVLSGLLVTGSVLDALASGRWSPRGFVVARLTRLWVVLVPCLVIGGLEDLAGLAFAGRHAIEGYAAAMPASVVRDRLDLVTFAGNMAFLQGARVPVFGSNVPLWTLAIEAWCYAGLLAATCGWLSRRKPVGLVCIAAASALGATFLVPPAFWASCPIWGLGALLALLRRWKRPGIGSGVELQAVRRHIAIAVLLATALALAGARTLAIRHLALSDYLLAIAVAGLLAAARAWRPSHRGVCRFARGAGGLSYTLYVSHYPLLALLAAVALRQERQIWSGTWLAIWLAAVAAALLQAGALWWLFERHTGALRARFSAQARGGAALHEPTPRAVPT